MSGIEIIPTIIESSPDTVVIMISGSQNIQSAIESMRVGAFDFIQKPFDIDHIEVSIQRALAHHRLLTGKRRYENHLEELIEERTRQLDYLKYHDSLTDLPNRILFEDRLAQMVIQAQQSKQTLAVALVSPDHLSELQNTLGRPLTEQIVCEISKRLERLLSIAETTARFGTDEFALLLTQIPDSESLIKLIEEINEAINSVLVVEEHEIFVSVSIGISLYSDDGDDVQTLLKNAGAALSRAKQQGGNSYQFYTTDMNAKALRRLTMENQMRRALENEEFEVYYQPKIEMISNKIYGMEALLRWRNPTLGFISPAEFIPLSEGNGLIVPIGKWIMSAACRQSKKWADSGHKLHLSVNLSTIQLQETELAETILQTVEATGFAPEYLEFEVTESAFVKNIEFTVKTLNRLKKAGISISIDDFGTGYSSLGYLKSLPIDILKIDRSFVRDMTTDEDSAALVTAIISMSHNLRLKVIAEGVETQEQVDFLKAFGCNFWQGYLYSPPVAAEKFEELLTLEKSQRWSDKR